MIENQYQNQWHNATKAILLVSFSFMVIKGLILSYFVLKKTLLHAVRVALIEISLAGWNLKKYCCWQKDRGMRYDAVSDLMHNWVAQRPNFKSAVRVLKMVLNTQCYQYLWRTMWFHAKKSKETLKNSKSLILQCKFGSRAQKWPKIAKKTDH